MSELTKNRTWMALVILIVTACGRDVTVAVVTISETMIAKNATCTVSPRRVEIGSDYTIQITKLKGAGTFTLEIADPGGDYAIEFSPDRHGTYSTSHTATTAGHGHVTLKGQHKRRTVTVTTCSFDVFVPAVCGDGQCDLNEDCGSCDVDCGACAFCGDGTCDGEEDCESCATDCGGCPDPCGDGVCDVSEDCASCATDCGACDPCGDGVCDGSEDCASCATDCGACEPDPPTSGDPVPNRIVDRVDGDDRNDGSLSAPWKTLTQAANNAEPGDVVGIRAGTYDEGLYVNVSGDSGNRIVFIAHPEDAGQVILRGRCVKIIGQSHIEIRGLRIENCDNVGDHNSRGIYIEGIENGPTIGDIVLSGNTIFVTYSSAIGVWGVRGGKDPGDFRRIDGLLIENNTIERANEGGYNEQITLSNGVVNFEIAYNEIKNRINGSNGGEGIDLKEGNSFGKVHHNVVHDINKRAYYIDGGGYWTDNGTATYQVAPSHDIEFYANVAYNVPNAFAIMSEHGGDVYNIKIYNNLFFNTENDCAFIYDHPYTVDSTPGQFWNIEFVNNTFWDCNRNGLDLNTQQASSVTVNNNIFSTYKDRYESATEANNIIGGNPGFVNPSAGDYSLRPDSPAVDAGTSVAAPLEDLEGTSRPQGNDFDIGAFELVQ